MDLKKDMKKAFGIIEVEELHPPRAPPKPIVSEQSADFETKKAEKRLGERTESIADSKLAIDFSYLTTNSSFQRAIIEFIKKFIPGFENIDVRAPKEVVAKTFNKNIQNYKEVMKELKEVLKKREENMV